MKVMRRPSGEVERMLWTTVFIFCFMLTNVSPMARMRNSAGVYGKDVFGVECREVILILPVCVCVYAWVGIHETVWGGQKRMLGILLYHFLPYFLEAESLTEPEISVLTSWPAATPPPVGSVWQVPTDWGDWPQKGEASYNQLWNSLLEKKNIEP